MNKYLKEQDIRIGDIVSHNGIDRDDYIWEYLGREGSGYKFIGVHEIGGKYKRQQGFPCVDISWSQDWVLMRRHRKSNNKEAIESIDRVLARLSTTTR